METKTAKRSRRKYDADFRKEVIKMVESGRIVPDIAQTLGIGRNLIYQWLKRSKANTNSLENSSTVSFDAEKAGMYKKIKDLEMERDILKKALGIFSR